MATQKQSEIEVSKKANELSDGDEKPYKSCGLLHNLNLFILNVSILQNMTNVNLFFKYGYIYKSIFIEYY